LSAAGDDFFRVCGQSAKHNRKIGERYFPGKTKDEIPGGLVGAHIINKEINFLKIPDLNRKMWIED
jgi:hypothetical protein